MASEDKTEEHPFADIFNEDETDRNCLLSKPACFVIFGKPGAGKTTLARNIAQAWKCIRVEALSVLEEHVATENETGAMLQSLLVSGHSVPDELVTKLILEKIKSPEVAHFGYVITELPSLSQDSMTSLKQIEFVKNLELQPDIIINIKCTDYDLCQRISGQRQHSTTGYVYTRDQWDPEIIESRRRKKRDVPKEGKSEEEEEEEEQEEEEAFMAEMQMVAEILQHLVQRPEDYLENVEITVKLYKELLLSALEEVMAEHNPQYLIELDGNKSPEELFMTVIERLKYLNVRRAAIITKLQGTEEEMTDIIDTEELFRTVSSYKLIAPRYRWHRSKWARSCPVSLKDGNIYSGAADYTVSKMFCLSSEETLKSFSLNPRPFLLPPMPLPPCKLFLFGPEHIGKTTLANLIAEHFKAKVIDYNELVQPRFDSAREKLIKDTINEATQTAIKVVKERLLNEMRAKKQVDEGRQMKETAVEHRSTLPTMAAEEKTMRELEMHYGKKEYEDFVDYKKTKSSEELPSSVDDSVTTQDSKKLSSLEIVQEDKTKSDITVSRDKDVSTEELIEEVTENHPEVFAMMEDTLRHAKELNFEQPHDKQAEILEEVIKEETEDNKNRFPGAPKYGGWIVENIPLIRELWLSLMEKALIPDLVVYLSDTESNGKNVLHRMYLKNRAEIDGKILERLHEEIQAKKREEEEIRKVKEEELRLEEEKQRMMELAAKKSKGRHGLTRVAHHLTLPHVEDEADEEVDVEDSEIQESEIQEYTRGSSLPETSEVPEGEHEPEGAMLPEFPEDGYPNVPEMEPMKELLNNYIAFWKQMEQMISDSLVPILALDVSNKTPQDLLQRVADTMERSFKYSAWELNAEDYEEEAEDYQAETEVDEEQEEEEEEEEEGEEKIKEKRRHLGDTKHFCPVVLKENFVLQPGNTDDAVKYREKIYYFSSTEAKEKFLEHPEDYVSQNEPLKAPPLRICLLGPHGSGKTVCARKLAENFGIFHIQFEEFLQEKMLLKAERKFGPEFEDDSEEEQAAKQELEELASQANVKIEEDTTKKQLPEVQFTEEEEAIKLSLTDNEPLPSEVLDPILSEWWLKEPIRSETKIKEDMVAKRRAELILEREKKKKDNALRDEEEFSDEEDDEDDIENILEEEFPKDEEEMSEEDEEQEGDATERLRNELGEKFETETNNIQSIQDEFEKVLIPIIMVNGARKKHIVQYIMSMKLKPLVENRESIFEKCYPLSEGETIKPVENAENPLNPVIHRHYIYFLSSKQTKEKFMMNPIKYIRQPKPKATMPVRIMIVGPPKSGNLQFARKLASDYGLRRLSVGDALRGMLSNHPDAELSLMLNWHLHKGMTVPDELAIQALDISLMESVCNTVGLPYPLHNSSQIIAYKNAKYRKNVNEIRQFYQKQHQNWHVIDGFHSKWWVWNEVLKDIQQMNRYIQTYMEKIKEGKAARIDKLCITPEELIARLGEFKQFCPVSLAESGELIDCSVTTSLEFAAEFRGHYYKMSSQEKLNKFLKDPELYVPPLAPHPLPPDDLLPKRLTLSELKSRFPKCAELQGYCPVTYQDGKQRYEALVPGDIQYALEYRDRIFICESEEKLQKFLRVANEILGSEASTKTSPLKESIHLTSLPLPGYLEQGTATSLIKAMNAAGNLKPKLPFLSVRRAFNPKGSEYSRKKYKKKMEQFVERCELITYLSSKMTRKYKEPQFRAIDFDHKLQTFLSLKNIDPVTG
ncbi:Nucleoside-diphosphate kinase [Apodemus speciosus]|uniref:Nucleoside-diphosphate kinase n=1 Tax=Apodemus speciosus TaxID=105296 RepID=A0ABQ0F7F9_APOSI